MSFSGPIRRGRIRVTPLSGRTPVASVLEATESMDSPVLLESTALHGDWGRFSILACRPLQQLHLRGQSLFDARDRCVACGPDAVWSALRDAFGAVQLTGEADAPYLPGWIGYVGYETVRIIERMPENAKRIDGLPDLFLGFYDALLLFDAMEVQWTLVEMIFEDPPPGAGQAAEILRPLPDAPAAQTQPDQAASTIEAAESPMSNFTPDEYRQAVARCVDYIAAGDIFQVNLSQRLEIPNAPAPLDLYRALRSRNPAWYAAYLRFQSQGAPCAIVSSSPELFLRCRGRRIVTRPIKGTRPRIGDPAADADAARDLLASPKDNAELAMIIDLLRNDLGRICRFGTVRVAEPVRLETHPTVFHLVGTITGELDEGVGPAEALRATFPGGSITGAPKIRAMEIIDELEPSARGVYTGCIGIVGVDGSFEWNIAIRTIIHQSRRAWIQVGGGIVADSTPQGEYDETLDKARAILEAVRRARNV